MSQGTGYMRRLEILGKERFLTHQQSDGLLDRCVHQFFKDRLIAFGFFVVPP